MFTDLSKMGSSFESMWIWEPETNSTVSLMIWSLRQLYAISGIYGNPSRLWIWVMILLIFSYRKREWLSPAQNVHHHKVNKKMANSVEIYSIAGPSARKAILVPWLSQAAFKIHMNFCRNLLRSAFLMLCSEASLDANFPTKTLRKTKKKM